MMITASPPAPTAHLVDERPPSCDLVRSVERALHDSGYAELRHLAVDANGEVVTLAGKLPSYFLKQVAQTTATCVRGVRRVDNHTRVVRT